MPSSDKFDHRQGEHTTTIILAHLGTEGSMQRTDDKPLDACGDACLDAASPLGLLGIPDQILTKIITKAINQSFEFLRGRTIERPDFGDWKSLFKWRLISRRFCKLIDGSVLLATGAAPLLAAAVWTSLDDVIWRQHCACTLEYSLSLRVRLLELADKTSGDTEALATRAALTEEAAKLTSAPVLRERLHRIATNPENYTYVRAQIRIAAGAIDEMNTLKRISQVKSLSHYVASNMLRRIICSGHKFPDLRETPQIIVMWAATSDMAAEDIPYQLRRHCKSWQLAPQQKGLISQQDLIVTIHGNGVRLLNDQLCDDRRTRCACPDCKLNKK
jgi:hypothetical protein